MQIEMGFSLRQLEDDKKRLLNLRTKIIAKYKSKGLHVAELAQSGIVGRYIGILLGHTEDEDELREGIEEVLNDVDKYVLFLQSQDESKEIAETVINKINVLSPKAIILFSCGPTVMNKAHVVIQQVKKKVKGYIFELQFEEILGRRYDFILKQPLAYSLPQ